MNRRLTQGPCGHSESVFDDGSLRTTEETNPPGCSPAAGSHFWLFRDLSLQEGYPQPLSALRMGPSSPTAAEGNDVEGTARRWGLVWDPLEGPLWGAMEDSEDVKQGDPWTQLLREGVRGITTESDGEDRSTLTLNQDFKSPVLKGAPFVKLLKLQIRTFLHI